MNASDTVTSPVTLYHRNHARRKRGKSLSHLVPAVVLVFGALDIFTGRGPISALSWLEFATGAAYLVLLVREWRHLRRQHEQPPQERVAWLELAAASILALEGYHLWHRHHEAALAQGTHKFHVLPWLYGALAVWYVLMAFNVARLERRRYLHLHAEGFSGRLKPFGRPFHYRWADIASLEAAGPADLVIYFANGEEELLSFDDMQDGATYRDQLVARVAHVWQVPDVG